MKISRRNSGKDGLLDGGAKEIGEMLGRVERRRRRCAGVCVVGVVMAVVTDRALGGVGGICGKVCCSLRIAVMEIERVLMWRWV